MHEPQVAAIDDVARQYQAAGGLVHAQDGADQAKGASIFAQHLERKQQARSRQVLRVIAEVALVDIQRGLPVKLIQHVAGATRDLAHRTEWLPSVEGAMMQVDVAARKADRHDLPL